MNSFMTSLGYALYNIRSHFFHTLLSVLGIIIGVAALIAMLSMIDGLEKYANEQINQTTSIKVIEISSQRTERIDGVMIQKTNPLRIDETFHQKIVSLVPEMERSFLLASTNRSIGYDTMQTAGMVHFATTGYLEKYEWIIGESSSDSKGVVINSFLAKKIFGDGDIYQKALGKSIVVGGASIQIDGIVKSPAEMAEVIMPFHLNKEFHAAELFPFVVIEAKTVEDIVPIKEKLHAWVMESEFPENSLQIISQDFRVGQAAKGFQLFRLIMGMIIGISVLVGGVGVMNVLLISVTQRTHEIGLRKAVGAKKKDIYVQFLTEALVISVFGTLVGVSFGVLFTLGISPLIHHLMEIKFFPEFTAGSLFTVALISLVIGIVFGTFPAVKASRLDPIEALRRE